MTESNLSTPAAAATLHTMEIAEHVLTYEPGPHDRLALTWAGPLLGMPDRRLAVSMLANGIWRACVYAPGFHHPLAQAFYKNPEGAVARMFQNAKRHAIDSLLLLADVDLGGERGPDEGPHPLDLAVEAFAEAWGGRFGESRAAGVFGRFYDETGRRVTL